MAANLWFFTALGAAMTWGIGYVVSEKLMKMGMTPANLMFIGTLISAPFYFAIAWYLNEVKSGFEIMFSNWKVLSIVFLASFTGILGNFLVLTSVEQKNATMASLVEISYPLFTMLFAWLLFREVQINWPSAIGGLFIILGIAIIYLKG